MADLEQVDARHDAARDERPFDRSLGIAGQDRAEATMAQQEHNGTVVDVALG
jgi:hypothetical protein